MHLEFDYSETCRGRVEGRGEDSFRVYRYAHANSAVFYLLFLNKCNFWSQHRASQPNFQGKLINGFWKTELGCLGISKLEENVFLCVLTTEGRGIVPYFCSAIMPCLAKRVFTSLCAHNTAGECCTCTDWGQREVLRGTVSCQGWTALWAGTRPRNPGASSLTWGLFTI